MSSSLSDNIPYITVDQAFLHKLLNEIEQSNKQDDLGGTKQWLNDEDIINVASSDPQLEKMLEDIRETKNRIEKLSNSTKPNSHDTVDVCTQQTDTPLPVKKTSSSRKRSRKTASSRKRKITPVTLPATDDWTNWTVKPINDAATIAWTDCEAGYQRTVQNPNNCGTTLLKIQLFENGVAKHVSAVYVEPGTKVYNSMTNLVTNLEDMWVDRETGMPKVEGIVRTSMPLAAWRYTQSSSIQDGGATVPAKRKR